MTVVDRPRDPAVAARLRAARAEAATAYVGAAVERGALYLVAHASPPAWLPLADEAHPTRRALIAAGALVPAAVPGVALSPSRRVLARDHRRRG